MGTFTRSPLKQLPGKRSAIPARWPAARSRLRRSLAVAGVLIPLMAVVLIVWRWHVRREPFDLLIVNAAIYDGTGRPPFQGSLGVRGNRIAKVWRGVLLMMPRAARVINADGLALSPGFIDTHSHADFSIGIGSSPIEADNFVGQGVTTMIVGNCGRSSKDLGAFGRMVDRRKCNVNIASLVGLNTIRTMVMKESTAPASPVEINSMCALVRQQMEDGALGASTGYAYVPGRFASKEEIAKQLGVVAKYGGIHTSHIRDEGSGVLASVDEAVAASRAARLPVLISHLKITGRSNCSKYPALLARLRKALKPSADVRVFYDQYPYNASSTDLEVYVSDRFLALNHAERDRAVRLDSKRLKAEITENLRKDGFADLGFAQVASFSPRRDWQGLTIPEIDSREHPGRLSSLDSQLNVMLQMIEKGGAQMVYHTICSDVTLSIQRDLEPMVGSDSAIRYDDGTTLPHPRGWGTFPRYLSMFAIKKQAISVATAIHRMTDLAAQVFGLRLRGRIETGYYADLVLFDPSIVRDRATYRAPFLTPLGIRYVAVNGELVLEARSGGASGEVDIVPTGKYPGHFLRRPPRLRRNQHGIVPPEAGQESYF